MDKVYIGVMAVGGHKLWGVSGGRLAAGGGEVAGRACPAPTGGERKIVRAACPQAAAEGSRPLPTM